MSGDYSRDRFHPSKSFSRVRQQQGRVGLDADWNEAWDIQDRRWRAETLDLMGRCAVSPQTPEAFQIEPSVDGSTFEIGLGRLYVDGLLAENFGTGPETFDPVLAEARAGDPVPYTDQPYLPDEPPLSTPGRYLVYLDVWEREVTPVEDPDLLEPALRGVDTTARLQTLWQVHTLPLDGQASAGCNASLDEVTPKSTGRLSVSFDDSLVTDDPCVLPPTGGYRGAENHLYRIQIHDGGGLSEVAGEEEETGATFKWSRDNASIVIPVKSITGRKVSLESLGRDRVNGVKSGDWVELLDDHRELHQESGDLARVTDINEGAQEITLDRDIPIAGKRKFAADEQGHADRHTRLCRWDQREGLLSDGTVSVHAGPIQIYLENGVQVAFSTSDGQEESAFRTDDYWLFAARPGNASFELLDQAPPRGIHHHYCRLAVIDVGNDQIKVIEDCRPWKANAKAPCCIVTVGDGIVSQGDFTNDIQGAIDAVSPGGKVCVLEGNYYLSASLQVNKNNLSLVGCGHQTRIRRASGAAPGFSLISIQADDITICDLSWSASTGFASAPALSAEHVVGLDIVGCSMYGGSGAAIRLAACADVGITNCEIRGYPALLASQCVDVRVDSNRVSNGGLWIGTGSRSISITRNRITDGKGPGILLGDSSEQSDPTPAPDYLFVVKRSRTSFADSIHRVQLLTKEKLTEELLTQVESIAEPGSIQRVQVKDNLIEGMGGSGIATLYRKSLQTLEDIAELGTVDDLEIAGNRIANCVQDEPDCRFPDGSGFGAGVLLAGSSNVRIHQNYIANNGCEAGTDQELWPACGILAGDCGEVDISDNHCVDNGIRNKGADGTGDYLQAELALLYVKSRAFSRDALRIYNNVVRCKAGQAIIALSTGNMSIVGNTLESLSYRSQPLLISESNLELNIYLKDFLESITRCSCVLLLQYPGEPGPQFWHPSLLMLNANRISAYHGAQDFTGETDVLGFMAPGKRFSGASIGVLSGIGDISIVNNQAWYTAPINGKEYFHNAVVFCGEVRAVGNYFGGYYEGFSYWSEAVGFNAATSNMSPFHAFEQAFWTDTHCNDKAQCVRWDNNLPSGG